MWICWTLNTSPGERSQWERITIKPFLRMRRGSCSRSTGKRKVPLVGCVLKGLQGWLHTLAMKAETDFHFYTTDKDVIALPGCSVPAWESLQSLISELESLQTLDPLLLFYTWIAQSLWMNERWKMICGNRMAKFLTLAAFSCCRTSKEHTRWSVCIIRNVEGMIWERQRGIIFLKKPPQALDKNNVWVLLQCFPQPGRNQRQHSHNKTHSGREHCGTVTASHCLIYTVQSKNTFHWRDGHQISRVLLLFSGFCLIKPLKLPNHYDL